MRAPLSALFVAGCLAWLSDTPTRAQQTPAPSAPPLRTVLGTYCVGCHNERLRTGGLALDSVDPAAAGGNPELWERVIAKLRAGSVPPAGQAAPRGPARPAPAAPPPDWGGR